MQFKRFLSVSLQHTNHYQSLLARKQNIQCFIELIYLVYVCVLLCKLPQCVHVCCSSSVRQYQHVHVCCMHISSTLYFLYCFSTIIQLFAQASFLLSKSILLYYRVLCFLALLQPKRNKQNRCLLYKQFLNKNRMHFTVFFGTIPPDQIKNDVPPEHSILWKTELPSDPLQHCNASTLLCFWKFHL